MSELREQLRAAREAERKANAHADKLQRQLDFEESFESNGTMHVVLRRYSDGSIGEVKGVFEDIREANQFATGLNRHTDGTNYIVRDGTYYPMKAD